MTNLALDSRFRIPEHVLYRELDDEAVLLNAESGYYFTLNSTGLLVWQALGHDGHLASALEALESQYEADTARLTTDLFALVESLLEHELLELARPEG